MDDANGVLKDPRVSKALKPTDDLIDGPLMDPRISKVFKPTGAMNGMNGGMNGAIKTSPNGHAVGIKKNTVRPAAPRLLTSAFSVVARLLTWYSIFTVLFRCPATLNACDETSPRICKPYFELKQAVAPHLEPYYDTYAAPYVDLVRPYYHTIDRTLISPSWGYVQQYGAPRLHQAQAFSAAQWERSVRPRITKVQEFARTQYEQSLAPHIDRASSAFGPVYNVARTNILQTYHELLLPAYQYVQPHLWEGYRATSAFTSNTVVPSFIWAWNKTSIFLDATLWPQLRGMYVENVEPQLVKIGKRLGRYNTGKKLVPTDAPPRSSPSIKTVSSFTKPTLSASTTSTVSPSSTTSPTGDAHTTTVRAAADPARTRSAMEPVPPPEIDEKLESEDPVRRTAREVVAADLKDWQERYAKAADEGAAEIDERVQEIAKKMVRRNARITGKSLLEQLQTTAVTELVTLRRVILDIIGAVNKGSATAEEGQEQLVKAVRQAGLAVKAKAQDVRTWRETYEAEMQAAITKAAETHFTILENIRDLALQKIGMKWAWMDGITYKDWAKYHLLKSRFDEWKGELESHIVTHPSLEAAQIEGANIEDEAMKIAATTAKELARLKQVANWKLIAGDDTPEFDSTLMQQAAEAAEASKLITETAPPPAGEDKDSVTGNDSDGLSQAAEAGQSDSQASNSDPDSRDQVGQLTESDSTSFGDVSASSSPNSDTVEASNALPSSKEISNILKEEPSTIESGLDSTESFTMEMPAAEPTTTVKSAFLGAAAQSVPTRRPILDDEPIDDVSAMESVRQELKSAYSAAMSLANDQYSQALSLVSGQMRESPKPAHEQMLASVTLAYSKAMASASSRLDDALKAASIQLHGSTTTTASGILPTSLPIPQLPNMDWSRIESIAAERLQRGRAWAEEEYESAKVAIGLATPTPSTPAEHVSKLLDNARHNYYANLGVAHARYSEFLAAASSAFSSMTASPTPTDLAGTASSIASVASESAASAASGVAEGASSVVSAASAGASSAASIAGEHVSAAAAEGYSKVAAAGDKAVDSWEAVVTKISVQVYGAPTPTPWYSSIFDAATDYACSATSAASAGAASASSAAGAYVVAGSDEIARQYAAASSILSELVVGKEPTFSESVFSRLSAAYVTGASSASSFAGAAQETAASAMNQAGEAVRSVGDKVAGAVSDATEAVKDAASHARDEL